MHIDNVIFLILSKNAYTKYSDVPKKEVTRLILAQQGKGHFYTIS